MAYPRPYGKYVLLERLGLGGMSEVDLARQRMGDRDFVRFVVVKRIKTDSAADQAFINMFKDEARITAELHHANIGQLYDFGREGDEYFLALEYVQGMDVRALVNTLRERGQRVPVKVALRIICDVLDALDYAHGKRDALGRPMQIVHRDVNPRNIMVSLHGETKLIDFGVAMAANRLERTKTDHVKGKFSYMAPEQIKGEPIDGRADLFAVGLTLHELLAGYGPFYGLNQMQIAHRLVHGRLPKLPEVPDLPDTTLLEHAHDRSMAREPDARYPDAASMRKDLERVADTVGGLPTRDELARFLAKVDPELEERLKRKLEGYSGELDVTTAAGRPVPMTEPPPPMDGTIDRTQTVTIISPQTAVLGCSLPLIAAIVSAAAVTGVLGLFALSQMSGAPSTTEPKALDEVAPPPVPPDPQPAPPSPQPDDAAPPTTPEPAPVATAPQPAPTTTPRPKATAHAPAVVPEPTAPEPTPPSEPVAPAPEPTPEPQAAPEPKPLVYGTLMINAPSRDLSVLVDGKPAGKTPLEVQLPVGDHRIEVTGYASKKVRVSPNQRTPVLFR